MNIAISDENPIKQPSRKVLMVSPYVYPKIGGVERYVYELSKELMLDPQYQVSIVTANLVNDKYFVADLDGIEVHHIPVKWKFSNTPLDFSTHSWIRKVVDKIQPDIIHAHAPVPYFAEMAAINAEKRKFVLTYHSGRLRKGVWYTDLVLFVHEKLILPLLFKRSDAITTVSQATYHEMLSKFESNGKASVIPPGVRIFNKKPSDSFKSNVITYVGRVDTSSRWKGIDVLINAFAKVVKERSNLKLQIVGDGDAIPSYKKLCTDLGISDSVIFRGAIQGEDLESAYLESSMVVLPSTSTAESFGMVLLEAMSLGVPVIGSKIGGIVNLITDAETGLLFEPGDVSGLENAIKRMLDDASLRQLCVYNGLEKAKKYTWEVQAQKMKTVYDNVLAKDELKIVHVVPAYPPNLGGMEQRVEELVHKLREANISVEVITSDLGASSGVEVNKEIQITRLKKLKFFQTPISLSLPFVLLKVKADVFHIHVAQPFYPIIASLISFLRRKPYILHIRVIVETDHPVGKVFVSVYKKIFLKLALRRAAKCIILTDTYKDILVREYGVVESRIVTIPNATSFRLSEHSRKPLDESAPINLLAVGRLEKQKNYPFMLRVLKELQNYGDFKLTVIGTGNDEASLKRYATKLGVANKIVWKGRLHGTELEAEYENANILVHTAHFESFGTVFIEAMAKGLPICASKVLGAIDVVQDKMNGLLCDFDEEVFAQNICQLVKRKELYSELSKNNLSKVLQYRWENIVSRTIRLYDEV